MKVFRALGLVALSVASSVWAEAPGIEQMGKVNVGAYRLRVATQALHAEALVQKGGSKAQMRAAVARFEKLHELATAFHKLVETQFHQPQRTEQDFEKLIDAYVEAREALAPLGQERVARGFEEVQTAMDELVTLYGGYPEQYAARLEALPKR